MDSSFFAPALILHCRLFTSTTPTVYEMTRINHSGFFFRNHFKILTRKSTNDRFLYVCSCFFSAFAIPSAAFVDDDRVEWWKKKFIDENKPAHLVISLWLRLRKNEVYISHVIISANNDRLGDNTDQLSRRRTCHVFSYIHRTKKKKKSRHTCPIRACWGWLATIAEWISLKIDVNAVSDNSNFFVVIFVRENSRPFALRGPCNRPFLSSFSASFR